MFSWRLRVDSLAERVVFLPDKTDCHRDTGDEHLAGRGIPTQEFYAKFQAEIVHQQVYADNQNIAPKLFPTTKWRLGEGNVLIEPKACQQSDWENNTEREYMRGYTQFEAAEGKILQVVSHAIVVNQEIEHPVKHHIPPTTSGITKQLLRDEPMEREIEKINNFCNKSR